MKFLPIISILLIALATPMDAKKCEPKTKAPGVTTVAPPTKAPGVTTAAPSVTTAAPAVTTKTPAVTTKAPGVTTPAPVATTATPGVTTAAPGVTTAPPAVTTAAPITTPAPTNSTGGGGGAGKATTASYHIYEGVEASSTACNLPLGDRSSISAYNALGTDLKCGECALIKNTETGATKVVKIIDLGGAVFDLAEPAFKALDTNGEGYKRGHLNIEYSKTQCTW